MYPSTRKVKSNGKTIVGQFSSLKKKGVQFESGLEEGFLYILNFDSDVTSFHDQPIKMEYKDKAGVKRIYTPDYLVEYKNRRPSLFEVKSNQSLEKNRKELDHVFEEAKQFAFKKSWDFNVVTDKQINTTYCDNVRFLFRFETYRLDLAIINEVITVLSTTKWSTPNLLVRSISSDSNQWPVYIAAIWTLVSNKRIVCNYFERINMETRISISEPKAINELKYPYIC